MKMSKPNKNYSSKYSSESKRRKTVGITIRPDLLKLAREMNLNLSKTLEKWLKQIIESQNNRFLNECSSGKKILWCGRRDLNPSSRLGKPTS